MKSTSELWKQFSLRHPSLAAARTRLIRKTVIKVAVLEFVLIGALLAAYFAAKEYFTPLLVLGLVGMAVLPWVTVKPQRLMKKRFSGKITAIQYEQKRVTVGGYASRMYTSMTDATFILCTVTEENGNGKEHSFELPDMYAEVYREGDVILSLSGFAYPVNMNGHEKSVCPCCGGIYPTDSGECRNCV